MNKILLYGSGVHSEVVQELALSVGFEVVTIFDDLTNPYNGNFLVEFSLLISIGDNQNRAKIANLVNHSFVTLISPKSYISESATIGEGTIILPFSVVHTKAIIGKHVILNSSSVIEHHCQIADYVHIAPNATLCGNVTVGEKTLIGANATVIQGINIGANCVIGAGTVVITDVPDNTVVVGNPGRIIKMN